MNNAPRLRFCLFNICQSFVIALVLLMITLLVSNTNQVSAAPNSVGFKPPLTYPTGGAGPATATTGDFNGDGRLDIAVTNQTSGNLGIMLGNGDGTFQNAVTYATGPQPYGVTATDLNGDGRLDLIVPRFLSNQLDLFIGNGDGTFQPYVSYTVGLNPLVAEVADFNGDGRLDIVCSNNGSGSVSVLLGNGNGTFQPSINSPSGGSNATSLAVADFDNDGRVDLAVANDQPTDNIVILLGRGDGSFQLGTSYATGVGSRSSGLTAVDLNGDGRLDLVAGVRNPVYGFVLLGNGNGTFNPISSTISGGNPPYQAKVSDFDGDGRSDLVWLDPTNRQVSLLTGNGDGTFSLSYTCTLANSPYSLTIADLNGDGRQDVITVNQTNDNISILLNSGPVTLSVNDVSVVEGNAGTTSATFTVSLSSSCCQTVTVNYATADGTATQADSDYITTSGTLTFAPGEITKTVTVTVNSDTKIEPDEIFYLNLSGAISATITKGQGIGTILDDDTQVGISANDFKVVEGNKGTVKGSFVLNLTGISSQIITVQYATADGSATTADSDYIPVNGILTFTPGETSKTVEVTIMGDTRIEPDEVFYLNLSGATNARIIRSPGVGTIINDDENKKPLPADLVAQLRVNPDRQFSLQPEGLVTYTLIVKNIGLGKAMSSYAQFPIDPNLEVGFATFSDSRAWVSKIVTDTENPYLEIRLPDFEPNKIVTSTVAFRVSASAKAGNTIFTRFTVYWDDDIAIGLAQKSNAVRYTLTQDTDRNETGGAVQLFEPRNYEVIQDKDSVTKIKLQGDFYAPKEQLDLWYTDNQGISISLGYGYADKEGKLNLEIEVKDLKVGESYTVAGFGRRSEVTGSELVTVKADS